MRVLGRYMRMPAKPRKKPMSLSAFKKKVSGMLETISRLETTERSEAYGYLQNCVNVLGVHKLGLNLADLASLNLKPDAASSSKALSTEEKACRASPVKEVQETSATSSSIQVSVISRNDRVNVINYSKSDATPASSDRSNMSKSEPSKAPDSSRKAVQICNEKQNKPIQVAADDTNQLTVSNDALSEDLSSSETEPATSNLKDQKEKDAAFPCSECGAKVKSRRAMLAHLDRHLSTPVSCRACHRSFNSLLALDFHYEDFCVSKTLVCPQCEEVFSCRTHFNNHVEGHNRNNCQMCPALFTNRKNLVVHMADSHNVVMLADAAFVCNVPGCERRFVKKSTLHRHLQLHHTTEGQIVCITCGMYLEGEEEYKAHSQTHKLLTCEDCSETFTRRQQYLVHMASHESSKYKCVTCDQILPTKTRVLEHRKDGHQVEGLSVDFACEKCNERFHTSAELRDHSHTHKPPGAISCKYCHKTFSTKKVCNSHMRSQHGVVIENGCEASLICDQCGKQFRSPGLLSKHLNRVHSEQIYSCSYCDHKTNNEVNMRRHRALHTSQEQQYVCDQCGASFQALSTLKDHNLFVHSDERNFNCDVCNKSFKRKNDLRRHYRSHSNDRMYVCHCKQSYKFMSHLRRHQETAHKSVPNSRIVQRLVKDASGNLVKKTKPAKEKKTSKNKKAARNKADVAEPQEYTDDQVTAVHHENPGVQLLTVNNDDQVVTMSVSDLPISDQHVDPYNLQVAYDGLNYPDAKSQLVYTTTPPGPHHVMSLQLPQFELVEPMPYDADSVMDMSTTSHADMNNPHGPMLMSIAASESSSQPVMTLITGLEHNTLFTTQADIGTMTEHSNVYTDSLLHAHTSVAHVKSVDSFTEAHVLDPKTSQADISTMTDMYNVYESPSNMCVTQQHHHHHSHHTHELAPLGYTPLDPCHSILLQPDQTWHISEAANLAQYSTC